MPWRTSPPQLPWHFLNFFPLPHGHGLFLPGLPGRPDRPGQAGEGEASIRAGFAFIYSSTRRTTPSAASSTVVTPSLKCLLLVLLSRTMPSSIPASLIPASLASSILASSILASSPFKTAASIIRQYPLSPLRAIGVPSSAQCGGRMSRPESFSVGVAAYSVGCIWHLLSSERNPQQNANMARSSSLHPPPGSGVIFSTATL